MILDGLALRRCSRYYGINNTQWTVPATDGAVAYKAGDLAVLTQIAQSFNGTPPALVTPAGWTSLLTSVTFVNSSGAGVRLNTIYKIIATGDLGLSVTGMNASGGWNGVTGTIFDFNRPVVGVTLASSVAGHSIAGTGKPAPIVPAWDGGKGGAHLYWGSCSKLVAAVTNSDYIWTAAAVGSAYAAAAPDLSALSIIRTSYSFYPIGINPPASVQMQMLLDGTDQNTLTGMCLRIN